MYPVAELWREDNPSYADYLNESIGEYVAKGHYTEEYAQAMSTGELFAGNDGD
jgi:hypothetical protein